MKLKPKPNLKPNPQLNLNPNLKPNPQLKLKPKLNLKPKLKLNLKPKLKTDPDTILAQMAQAVARYPVPFMHCLGSEREYAQLSLCAVIVAALITSRTTDAVSAHAFRQLMMISGGITPASLCAMSSARIEQALKRVNYYRTKATHIKRIAKLMRDRSDEEVIKEAFLLSLPGVGRKTAHLVHGVWLKMQDNYSRPHEHNTANRVPYGIAVDTHLLRIFYRMGITSSRHNAERTERELMIFFPSRYWLSLNDYGVRFGQYICVARQPKCDTCPFTAWCPKREV